jgi:hypothetical protein
VNIPDDCHLAYIVSHEAWYWNALGSTEKPHLNVQAAAYGGGVAWEFDVSEYHLGGKPCTRIQMFDDAYESFAQIPEFFILMREHRPGTLREVRGILDGLGAADLTQRARHGDRGPKVVKGSVVTGMAVAVRWPPERHPPGADAGPNYGEAAYLDDEIGGMT